jgi:hypothetical protein
VLKKSGGGKKAAMDESDNEEKKEEQPKWDFTQLEVGNTFSGTSYYKAKVDSGAGMITARSQGTDITISKEIIET